MKTTVILTTHDLADIEEICSKIIVIDDGKKVYEGSVADLKKQYNKYKLVKFELKPGQTVSNNSLFNASSDDIQTIVENDYITVQFLRDKFEIADIVSTVLSKFQIRDITIEEQGMEDIVKAIYQRK